LCNFLVFLHLLEGEAQCGTQLFLAHCKHYTYDGHVYFAARSYRGTAEPRPWSNLQLQRRSSLRPRFSLASTSAPRTSVSIIAAPAVFAPSWRAWQAWRVAGVPRVPVRRPTVRAAARRARCAPSVPAQTVRPPRTQWRGSGGAAGSGGQACRWLVGVSADCGHLLGRKRDPDPSLGGESAPGVPLNVGAGVGLDLVGRAINLRSLLRVVARSR
jgi:hypothetical protein